MKSRILIILIQLVIINLTVAQTKRQISQLNDLCNVWGNLKYFHPEIATGKHNLDSIAVSAINNIINGDDKNAFQNQIDKMMKTAGKNKAAEFVVDRSMHPHTYRNIDHLWIEKSKNLSENQKESLKYNYSHPFQGQNFYTQNNPDDEGNIITPNEQPYPEMKFPDIDYRLLGLFRFWNVINYYYPYKYATDKPWQKVLTDLIPEFIQANDILAYQKSVLKMSASIDDGHGGVYPFIDLEVAGKYNPPFF